MDIEYVRKIYLEKLFYPCDNLVKDRKLLRKLRREALYIPEDKIYDLLLYINLFEENKVDSLFILDNLKPSAS